MAEVPEIQSKVPSDKPKFEIEKPSRAVMKLLKACLIVELIGKWQILKNRTASFNGLRFKIEPASRESEVMFHFFDKKGCLERPVRAREVLMDWEKKDPSSFIELGRDLVNRELETIEPVTYEKGSFQKILKIRDRLTKVEKRFLETKLTSFEQTMFYMKQPEWGRK